MEPQFYGLEVDKDLPFCQTRPTRLLELPISLCFSLDLICFFKLEFLVIQPIMPRQKIIGPTQVGGLDGRSEERRVGKECLE